MTGLNVGFLHPGEMGISLAVSAQESGHTAYWVSDGRSNRTRERAERFNLVDAGTLKQLCRICSVIVSVCPPHAAEEVAANVLSCSYTGLYLDANAISPQRSLRISDSIERSGARYVDGGIIGGPAWEKGETRLYLSGPEADRAAACFSSGALDVLIIGDSIGKASALKMCYAANTKGTTALLCAIVALAERLEVRSELNDVWSHGGSDFSERTNARVTRVTRKAWRFMGEMGEIADTFENVGLPGGFHRAAGTIYQRIAHFKEADELPNLELVLESLLADEDA
jgi:3-hydroxyisobutyrate dehydrogenase-like beta-hydroxyacid dehydrogenase